MTSSTKLSFHHLCFLEGFWRAIAVPEDVWFTISPCLKIKDLKCVAQAVLDTAEAAALSGVPFNVQAVLENFIIQRPDLFVEEGVADEFFAKLEALVKFSEDTKDIFKVVAVDDQIGAGVDIIGLPKDKLGLYSHCLFR